MPSQHDIPHFLLFPLRQFFFYLFPFCWFFRFDVMCQRVKITKKVVINFLGRFSFSTFITTTSLIWVYFWHFSFYFLFLYFRRLLLRFSFFSRGWLVELLYFCYIHLHPIISIYFFGIIFCCHFIQHKFTCFISMRRLLPFK